MNEIKLGLHINKTGAKSFSIVLWTQVDEAVAFKDEDTLASELKEKLPFNSEYITFFSAYLSVSNSRDEDYNQLEYALCTAHYRTKEKIVDMDALVEYINTFPCEEVFREALVSRCKPFVSDQRVPLTKPSNPI